MAPSTRAMAAFLLGAVILLLGVTARAAAQPEATIASFTYLGTGCPANSAVKEISKDGKVLTLKFSKFGARTDGGITAKRKNCQISIQVTYPSGWIYSLEEVRLRGHTRLDDLVKAVHKVSYYFAGDAVEGKFFKETTGTFDDNYEHAGPFSPLISSTCGQNRNLNVNMQVRVDNTANPSGLGTIDVDVVDTTVAFKLKWEACY